MNQIYFFHMDDTHHIKTNICETIVKIIVFDEKKLCKKLFFTGSHRFTRNFLFLFDYRPIYIYLNIHLKQIPRRTKKAEPKKERK